MIGVIADDLTGAAEIGAVGLRHGLRAEIVTDGQPSGKADLVCVDTDSRAKSPQEAARRVTAATKLLQNAGAQWIYKKVDSVLRGQVTMEIEAVMQQLGVGRALLAPANPSLGRTIRNGKYFVGGRPLHRTDFLHDPQFPRTSAHVLELIFPPQFFPLDRAGLGDELPATGIVLAEAATAADVGCWAARRTPEMLPAGGAEFFSALLTVAGRPAGAATAANFPAAGATREFFVSGSATVVARKFAAAARRQKTPVFSLPLELGWGVDLQPEVATAISQRIIAAFATHSRVVLAVGLPPVRDGEISQSFSSHIVRIAKATLARVTVGHVYADGGATAAELVWRMGWSRLEVRQELAPGVATLAVAGEKNLLLTIKPGSYAWPAGWTAADVIAT